MSAKPFLDYLKKYRENKLKKVKEELKEYTIVQFAVTCTVGYGWAGLGGVPLIQLDDEDLLYFEAKACKMLEAERQAKIDEINKQYNQTSTLCQNH